MSNLRMGALALALTATSSFGAVAFATTAGATPYPVGSPSVSAPTAVTGGTIYDVVADGFYPTCTTTVTTGCSAALATVTTDATPATQAPNDAKTYPVEADGTIHFNITTSANDYSIKVTVTETNPNTGDPDLTASAVTLVATPTLAVSGTSFTAKGLDSGASYQLVDSTGTVLATFTAGADGTATVTAVPSRSGLISVRPVGGTTLASVSYVVVVPVTGTGTGTATGGTTASGLPFTGSDFVLPGLGLGVVLVAAGGAFVVASRRRVTA